MIMLVLLRELNFSSRPFHINIRIIPSHAIFIVRLIEASAFVHKSRCIRQHYKAMQKTFRYKKLLLVISRKQHTVPLTKGRAVFSDVYSYVPYFTINYSDQLCLRMAKLHMQAAQYSFSGFGLVILNKFSYTSINMLQ